MVSHQLQVRCRPVKVRRSETDVLPLSHPTNLRVNNSAKFDFFSSIDNKAIKMTSVGDHCRKIFDGPILVAKLGLLVVFEQVGDCSDGTDLLYCLSKFGGNRKTHIRAWRRSVMFFTLSHFCGFGNVVVLVEQ